MEACTLQRARVARSSNPGPNRERMVYLCAHVSGMPATSAAATTKQLRSKGQAGEARTHLEQGVGVVAACDAPLHAAPHRQAVLAAQHRALVHLRPRPHPHIMRLTAQPHRPLWQADVSMRLSACPHGQLKTSMWPGCGRPLPLEQTQPAVQKQLASPADCQQSCKHEPRACNSLAGSHQKANSVICLLPTPCDVLNLRQDVIFPEIFEMSF